MRLLKCIGVRSVRSTLYTPLCMRRPPSRCNAGKPGRVDADTEPEGTPIEPTHPLASRVVSPCLEGCVSTQSGGRCPTDGADDENDNVGVRRCPYTPTGIYVH